MSRIQEQLTVISNSADSINQNLDVLASDLQKIKMYVTDEVISQESSKEISKEIHLKIDALKKQFEDLKMDFMVYEMLHDLDIEIL